MPTVLRIGGLRIMIYSSDHRPAHVHVIGGGGRGSIQPELPQGAADIA
ncbi:MAG TPA: DUF4160 domain-containing protein [Reyranella sp.]